MSQHIIFYHYQRAVSLVNHMLIMIEHVFRSSPSGYRPMLAVGTGQSGKSGG